MRYPWAGRGRTPKSRATPSLLGPPWPYRGPTKHDGGTSAGTSTSNPLHVLWSAPAIAAPGEGGEDMTNNPAGQSTGAQTREERAMCRVACPLRAGLARRGRGAHEGGGGE